MSSLPAAGQSSDLRPLAEWYLRKGHRRLWFMPTTLGLIVLITVLILRGTMEDPADNYDKSRAAVEALKQPPVPEEENAWEDYKKALAVRMMYKGNDDNNPFYKTDDDSRYFKPDDVQELWKANAEAIALLHASGDKPRCDMGIDQVAKPFDCPSLLNARESANLLALDARCNAIAGNHVAAAKSLRAIRGLAKHIETQPLLINEMIATAINGIANEAFAAIVCFDTPTKIPDLEAYKQALEPFGDPFERAAKCVKYENSIALYYLDSYSAGKVPLMFPRGSTMSPQIATLWHGSDRRCFVAVANEASEALSKRQMPTDALSAINRHQTGPAVLTRICMPSFSRSMLAFFEVEEQSRLAVVAAAFLQYRFKNGRDAHGVEQLVPEFLPAIPKGAYHDKPILVTREKAKHLQSSTMMDCVHYKERPSVRIYTVGRNGIDDGGNNEGFYAGKNDKDDGIFHVPLAEKTGK